jgi:hypothetical protein
MNYIKAVETKPENFKKNPQIQSKSSEKNYKGKGSDKNSKGKGSKGKGKGKRSGRNTKNIQKNIEFNKTFKHYQNLYSSIPEYIIEKLYYMPNNRGYIWKGICCFGEKPADNTSKIVIFEKQRNLSIIHEWDYKLLESKIWHKYDRQKKELFKSEKIVIKKLSNNQ